MKILVFDSSDKSGSVALFEGTSELGFECNNTLELDVRTLHSEQLLWGIDQCLGKAKLKLGDVDQIAVGVGPGSFTGLRIGLTTARTLAEILKIPLLPFSSLIGFAYPIAMDLVSLSEEDTPLIVTAIDACKGEVFSCFGTPQEILECVYSGSESKSKKDSSRPTPSLWNPSVIEAVFEPADLAKILCDRIEKRSLKKAVLIGNGWERYSDEWAGFRKKVSELSSDIEGQSSKGVKVSYLGDLLQRAVAANISYPPLDVHPKYLRASNAELKLKLGQLPSGPSRW